MGFKLYIYNKIVINNSEFLHKYLWWLIIPTKTITRQNVFVRPDIIGIEIIKGIYENSVILFLDKILANNMVVFDIGANIGIHSIFMAKKVSPHGKVYAFEPSTRETILLFLNKIQTRVNNLNIETLGVSNSNGFEFFYIFNQEHSGAEKNYGLNTTVYPPPWAKRNIKSKKYSIKVTKLDSYVRKNKIKNLDLIKIDTEGSEIKILNGSKYILKKFKPTLIIEMEGETYKQILSITKNYYWFFINKNGILFQKPIKIPLQRYRNMVAIHHDKITAMKNFISKKHFPPAFFEYIRN